MHIYIVHVNENIDENLHKVKKLLTRNNCLKQNIFQKKKTFLLLMQNKHSTYIQIYVYIAHKK